LVTGFTHGLKLGVLLRRKLLWTENSTVVPLTTDQLTWVYRKCVAKAGRAQPARARRPRVRM
jgi:hypothetical protein